MPYLTAVASTSSLTRDVPLAAERGSVVTEIRERRSTARSRPVACPEARRCELVCDQRGKDQLPSQL